MGSRWLRNLLQFPLDFNFKHEWMLEIPYPRTEFTLNHMLDVTPFGLTAGYCLAQFLSWLDPKKKPRQLVRYWTKWGCLAGEHLPNFPCVLLMRFHV